MPVSSRKKAPKKEKKPVPVRNDMMFNSDHPMQFAVLEDIAKDKKVNERQIFEKPTASKKENKSKKKKWFFISQIPRNPRQSHAELNLRGICDLESW